MKRGFWIYFLATLCVVISAVAGLTHAWRSELWTVKDVQIQVERAPGLTKDPISVGQVENLLGIRKGQDPLFGVSGAVLRDRVLTEGWVRDATVEKSFPARVQVQVRTREPIAIVQWSAGPLAYLDASGEVFGEFDFEVASDLPILTGIQRGDRTATRRIADFLTAWKHSKLHVFCQISQLLSKDEGALEVVVSFPQKSGGLGRLSIDLGQEFDVQSESHFERLERVLKTIATRGIPAKEVVFADGKKIVVRTAPRS